MIKTSYRDLIITLGLSILSLVCLITPALNTYPINLIPTILLLLFLPGYSILAACDPLFNRSGIIKKVLFSILVSLIITVFLSLLSTYTPLKVSNYIILVVFTIILCIIAMLNRRNFSRRLRSLTQEEEPGRPAEEKEPEKIEYEKIRREKAAEDEIEEYEPEEIPSDIEKPLKEEISSGIEESPKEGKPSGIEGAALIKEDETPGIEEEKPSIHELKEKADKPKDEKRSYKDIITSLKLVKDDEELSKKDELERPPQKLPKTPKKPHKPPETPQPKIKSSFWDLVLVIILTALCALFVLEPTLNKTVIRTVLGLLLVLFLPGYALIASLFPKKDDLDSIERLALSFGLSIAITPLIGLALNYTPYGIRLDPILISLSSVTLLLCAVAYIRRRKIPRENRFMVDFSGFFHGLRHGFQGESRVGKILSVVLIISIILAISTTAYIIVKPKEGESFTEFYILGPGGKASDYPTNLTSGQEGKLTIGVVNHENNKTSYHLVVTSNGTVQDDRTFTLQDGQKLEIPFNFTAGEAGERKMEFKLYKLPDNKNIYRSLHLWLNITGSSNETTG